MADITDLNPKTSTEDQASAWIARIDRGLHAEEHDAFQAWLTANHEHYNVFMEMAEFWDMTEQFKNLPLDTLKQYSTKIHHTPERKNISFQAMAVAAGIVLAVSAYLFSAQMPQSNDKVLYATSITSDKKILVKSLPDGSTVSSNAGTIIDIQFTAQSRKIVLKAGELFVEVAHEAARDFIVHANGRIYRALGTAFSVSLKANNQVDMIVKEGQVSYQLEDQHKSIDKAVAKAGEKVASQGKSFNVSKFGTEELERSLSWRSGILIFKNDTLEQVVKQFSRYSDKEIQIENPNIAQERITGRFDAKNVQAFIELLEEGLEIVAYETEAFLILKEKDKN